MLVLDQPDERLDPDGQGLLGLYVGVPLPERGANYAGELPDVIYLFRQPHLALGLAEDELREEIADKPPAASDAGSEDTNDNLVEANVRSTMGFTAFKKRFAKAREPRDTT